MAARTDYRVGLLQDVQHGGTSEPTLLGDLPRSSPLRGQIDDRLTILLPDTTSRRCRNPRAIGTGSKGAWGVGIGSCQDYHEKSPLRWGFFVVSPPDLEPVKSEQSERTGSWNEDAHRSLLRARQNGEGQRPPQSVLRTKWSASSVGYYQLLKISNTSNKRYHIGGTEYFELLLKCA